MAGLVALAPAWASPSGQPAPELLGRLRAAIADAHEFNDRYAAEVWFVDMSGRLARYAPQTMADPSKRLDFLRILHAEAARARVSPELVLAVIDVESDFQRFAISKAGAEGYMQIMPFWLEEAGGKDDNLFHARTNLRMGCTILRYYLDRAHDDWVKALAMYNGSTGRADYPYKVLHELNTRWSPG